MNSPLRVNGALVVCFLRSDSLDEIFKKLLAAGITDICVWIDGPRSTEESKIQTQILKKITAWGKEFKQFSIQQNTINFGLNISMVKAIDWYFSNHDDGLILEDDILISEQFVNFINMQIQIFNSREEVLLLGGHNPNPHPQRSGYILSNYPLIWGWYTNEKKWRIIRNLIVSPAEKPTAKLRANVNNFWESGIKNVESGKLRSWALPFAFRMRSQGFLAMNPHVNLIKNVGVDNFATHTKEPSNLMDTPIQEYVHNPEQRWENETPDELNNYLERYVYKIRFRHYFIPIRVLIRTLIPGREP